MIIAKGSRLASICKFIANKVEVVPISVFDCYCITLKLLKAWVYVIDWYFGSAENVLTLNNEH